MGVKNIAKLGKMIAQFLGRFAPCFVRIHVRSLRSTYVQGLLSDVQRRFFLDFSGKGEVRFRSFDLGTGRWIFEGIRSCVP